MSDEEEYYEDNDIWFDEPASDATLFSMEKCSNEKFIEMIEKGYDINQQNSRGWTLLGYLMQHRNIEKIDILLKSNINLNVSLQNKLGRNIFFSFCYWDYKKEYLDIADKIISLDTTGDLINAKNTNGYTAIDEYKDEIQICKKQIKIFPHQKDFYDKKISFYEAIIIRFKNHVMMKKSLFMIMLPDLEDNNKKQRVY